MASATTAGSSRLRRCCAGRGGLPFINVSDLISRCGIFLVLVTSSVIVLAQDVMSIVDKVNASIERMLFPPIVVNKLYRVGISVIIPIDSDYILHRMAV